MIKICCAIPSLHPGGMERVMSEILQDFTQRPGVELHLVLFGIKRDTFYPVPESVVIHRPSFAFNNKYRLISTLRTLWFLRNKISQLKPDRVLSFGESWNSFVLLSLLGTGNTVYISDRCQPDKYLGFFQETFRKLLYPGAKGIIAQTGYAMQEYQRRGFNNRVVTIGNPIRSIEIKQNPEKENWVLSVGRLISTKHHEELIKLFCALQAPGWKLVIVGGDAGRGRRLDILKKLVADLNAQDQVILAGNQENVDTYYLKSKIFAFTSSSEGFPNVIGEAMSAGLPVVTFDCVAGPSDMILNEQSGFLIPLFDYDLFSRKLNLLIQDETLRSEMGSRAKTAIKKFSKDEICQRFFETITSN